MDKFCREKGIKREYSIARTPQQNGVAKRKNRTVIEAARTMLADSKIPTTFWAEAVSTLLCTEKDFLVVSMKEVSSDLIHVFLFLPLSSKNQRNSQALLRDPAWVEANVGGTSLQYKTAKVVATSTTEAEYVAATSCCGQIIIGLVPKARRLLVKTHQILYLAGSGKFHQIIDFLNRSHICYALTKKPEVCVSFIKQFWRSAEASTDDNREVKINATIDGHSLSITEGSYYETSKLLIKNGPIKGYSARMLALIPTMIDLLQPSTSPTRIPSSPTLLPEHSPSPTPSPSPEPTPAHTTADVTQPSPTQPSPTQPSPTQPSPTQPGTEHHLPTPHDSPLHAVHSHGSDEVLEAALMQTKKTYVLLIRSLFSWSKAKSHIKIGKKGGQARVVLSDDKSPMKIILQTWEKYLMQSSRKSNQEPVCPRKEKKYDQILKNQGNYQDRVTFQAKSPEKEKSPEKNVEEEVDTTIKMKEGCKRNWSKEKESIPEKATRKSQKMEEER
ncbi:putative ribonuclease H-like domain-containing protein [Tanacetum coccineum]